MEAEVAIRIGLSSGAPFLRLEFLAELVDGLIAKPNY
jgi:hypothetical protein